MAAGNVSVTNSGVIDVMVLPMAPMPNPSVAAAACPAPLP